MVRKVGDTLELAGSRSIDQSTFLRSLDPSLAKVWYATSEISLKSIRQLSFGLSEAKIDVGFEHHWVRIEQDSGNRIIEVKGAFVGTEAAASLAVYVSKATTFRALGLLPADILVMGLITGASLMVGSFIARRFVLKMEPGQFRLLMDGLMLKAAVVAGSIGSEKVTDGLTFCGTPVAMCSGDVAMTEGGVVSGGAAVVNDKSVVPLRSFPATSRALKVSS